MFATIFCRFPCFPDTRSKGTRWNRTGILTASPCPWWGVAKQKLQAFLQSLSEHEQRPWRHSRVQTTLTGHQQGFSSHTRKCSLKTQSVQLNPSRQCTYVWMIEMNRHYGDERFVSSVLKSWMNGTNLANESKQTGNAFTAILLTKTRRPSCSGWMQIFGRANRLHKARENKSHLPFVVRSVGLNKERFFLLLAPWQPS